MTQFIRKIAAHKVFIAFVFLFAYAQSIQIRIWVRNEINIYTFTPEAALVSVVSCGLLFYIIHYFIKKWTASGTLTGTVLFKIFGISLLVYVATMKSLGFMLALLFNTVERNFNTETLLISSFSELMNGLIYGSFFIAYYYYIKFKAHQQRLSLYNKALSESKISQLKHQLNPHFLFNNLNVLDQLIDEDKEVASAFLNEFADIYRYVLNSSDTNVISVQEEILFVEKYFKLITHKYGSAYQLEISGDRSEGYIVPLTLQLLIENALQHNLGSLANPVFIKINVSEELTVTNTFRPKRNAKLTSGRALNNLQEQYVLLGSLPFEIEKVDGLFSVKISLISKPSV